MGIGSACQNKGWEGRSAHGCPGVPAVFRPLETSTRRLHQNGRASAGLALLLLAVACSGSPSAPTNSTDVSGASGSPSLSALTVIATANGGTTHPPMPPTPCHPSSGSDCGGGGGGGGDGGGDDAPTGNASTVSILGQRGSQSFSPNPLSPGGGMVAWRNDDGVTHRIVANDGSFDTGNLLAGATSSMVQPSAGGVNYHCSIHLTTMFGSISSDDGGEPPPCTDYCE